MSNSGRCLWSGDEDVSREYAVHRGHETLQIGLSLQCFRFTEDLLYFHNKRGCQAILLRATTRLGAVYVQVPCVTSADRMRRDGQTAALRTDSTDARRSALHHRLRRCWLAARQTRRRTGWAIASSFNTKSAERRNAERRPANATLRNKTVAMFHTKTFAIQCVIIGLPYVSWHEAEDS